MSTVEKLRLRFKGLFKISLSKQLKHFWPIFIPSVILMEFHQWQICPILSIITKYLQIIHFSCLHLKLRIDKSSNYLLPSDSSQVLKDNLTLKFSKMTAILQNT